MLDAAHAVHSDTSGPRVPSSIETHPAARFGSVCTIENGLTRSGPRRSIWRTHSSNELTPPIAVAIAAPVRSATRSTTRPESASA